MPFSFTDNLWVTETHFTHTVTDLESVSYVSSLVFFTIREQHPVVWTDHKAVAEPPAYTVQTEGETVEDFV